VHNQHCQTNSIFIKTQKELNNEEKEEQEEKNYCRFINKRNDNKINYQSNSICQGISETIINYLIERNKIFISKLNKIKEQYQQLGSSSLQISTNIKKILKTNIQ